MKVTKEAVAGKNFLVIDTEIPVASYRKGITNLTVKDEDGEPVFFMNVKKDAEVGTVTGIDMTVNGEKDGNFAVVIPVASDAKLEDLKVKYGAALVEAEKHLGALKTQMAAEAEAVDAMFAAIPADAN